MKIYVKELKCYQSLPEEVRKKARISGLDPKNINKPGRDFIP